MLNLMKLEVKKYKISGNVVAGFIATFIMMIVIIIINFLEGDKDLVLTSYEEVIGAINIVVSATFMIFAAVLIAKFIIHEYRDKTITVLFMYPIARKKLIIAKLLVIWVFTFAFGLISKIVIFSSFYTFNHYAHLFEQELTTSFLWRYGTDLLVNTVMMSCISLIPLYFGMRKKSVTATIVSSLIISMLLYSNTSIFSIGFTLSSIIIVLTIVSMLGIFIAYHAIRHIDHWDVL